MDDYTEHEKNQIRAVGRQIAAERTKVEMSQEALAERAGISRKSLSRYEQGERDATLGTLVSIADALGMPLTQLLLAAEARPGQDTRPGAGQS